MRFSPTHHKPAVLSLTVVAALALAGCSGGSELAPTVTQTVDAPTSASGAAGPSDESSAPASTPTPSSSSPSHTAAPKKPVSVRWIHKSFTHQKGRFGREDLYIPALVNASPAASSAFDAAVSKKAADFRSQLTDSMPGKEPDPESSLKMLKGSSTVYKGRYVSVGGRLAGDPTMGSDGFMSSFSVNLDLQTNKLVPLTTFVTAPSAKVDAVLLAQLKAKDVGFGHPDPAKDGYMDWTVGSNGVTFTWVQVSEGGWDFSITLPWSEVRG